MAFFDIFKKKQDNSAAQASEERKQQQEELNAGLEKTKTGLFSKLARAVAGRSTVDADVLDDLEEVLISSDVGVETTVKIIRGIEERVARDKYMGTSELQSILREEVTALMEESHGSEKHFGLDAKEGEPYVVMVVGVNGAGKTTTIGKLAAQLTKAGQKVWIGAAMVTIIVRGEVGAVRTAVDAGAAAANKMDALLSCYTIARPTEELVNMLQC